MSDLYQLRSTPPERLLPVPGLLRKEQEKQEQRNRNLEDAFRDLDGLMQKAGEMVQMGEMLRLRVRKDCEEGGALDAGVGQEMDDLLLDVGIVNPVTKESAGALYHKQLSRQVNCLVVMRGNRKTQQ